MKASQTNFHPIIEGVKQYVIPLFQRHYTWEKAQWETLWNDLMELYEAEQPRNHFIGSLVTMPTTSVPEGVTKFLLIDGQQRLTTIFILLALLRDKAREVQENKFAEEIHQTFIVNHFKDGIDYYKLHPTQKDQQAFRDIIQGKRPISNQCQIHQAYEYFEKQLRRNSVDIRSFTKIITGSLSVVSILLENDDNPYLVFESLNAKGQTLTQADLIRNYFLMRIHVNTQETMYAEYWEPMQRDLGEDLTEFIRHYLMKDGGEFVKTNDIYFVVKERLAKLDIIGYLKNLSRFAAHYHKLLSPEHEQHAGIRRMLSRLNRIEATTAYPFLLNCYDDYVEAHISSEDFIAILQVVENFMIRRFVCNVPTNQLNKIFPPLYTQAKATAGTFIEAIKTILQTKQYPKDAEFMKNLLESKLYGGGNRANRTRLILETLEESFGHKEQVTFDNLSIEHVMPQTLTDAWQKHLGEDWEITHELYLHTLGNLTLTAYNSELSNDDFQQKRLYLIKSHLELNTYFQTVFSWGKEEIEKRSSELAEAILALWPYFGDRHTIQSQESVTGTTPKILNILDQTIPVKSWRDVLEQTMNTIAELEPAKFDQLMLEFPRFIGKEQLKFHAARQLKNGVFIEVNLSSKTIQTFCLKAIESIELTNDDWHVETSA
ncbi:uncharacterized conserved protein [Candidatus Moduliflexus flocculans]|uniref:Uncharacterized conserved protein n=1 Tax=Candidatus Moduliflexus flocculans TaxID=1499966 RepID=A0A0S6VS04_9BACT|nr:uncharacterized conserved protein [Candidatus Moduliflexus flocculans]